MSRVLDRLTKVASAEQEMGTTKKSSLAEYSALFDAIADGKLGNETKEALAGICESYDTVYSSKVEKVAHISDNDNKLAEHDARSARLDQLLRRY